MNADQQAVLPVTFVALEITGKCQLECVHCYAGSGPEGTHGTMTSRDWERLIDDAAGIGVRTVQIIGGEPTLHPDLPRLVRHAVAAGLCVEVFSNLVRVSPDQWAAFSLPGVSLATSWYTSDPAVHARTTGRADVHARTRANIAEAVRQGIRVRAGIVEIADGSHVEQARAELASLGVTDIGAADRVRRVGRAADPELSREPDMAELCGRCGQGMAAVSPEGELFPCVMSRWLPAGNLLRQDLSGILSGPRWRAVLAALAPVSAASDPCNPDKTGCKPKDDGGDCQPAEKPACRPKFGE